MTRSGKIGLVTTITDIHFLSVHESYTHASLNTKYLIIDGQVCFYRRLFTDAVLLVLLGLKSIIIERNSRFKWATC